MPTQPQTHPCSTAAWHSMSNRTHTLIDRCCIGCPVSQRLRCCAQARAPTSSAAAAAVAFAAPALAALPHRCTALFRLCCIGCAGISQRCRASAVLGQSVAAHRLRADTLPVPPQSEGNDSTAFGVRAAAASSEGGPAAAAAYAGYGIGEGGPAAQQVAAQQVWRRRRRSRQLHSRQRCSRRRRRSSSRRWRRRRQREGRRRRRRQFWRFWRRGRDENHFSSFWKWVQMGGLETASRLNSFWNVVSCPPATAVTSRSAGGL
jgi:hypothetical protein